MIEIRPDLFDKLSVIADNVKTKLKRKGFVIPVKNKDGSISFDHFRIIRSNKGCYKILKQNETIIDNINLLQSASLLANELAVSRQLDQKLYQEDQAYGHKLFETTWYQNLAQKKIKDKNYDLAEIFFTKSDMAKSKSLYIKREITDNFYKLIRSAK